MQPQNNLAPVILVLDDVEEIRDGIEKLLTKDGYRVETARNEKEVLRQVNYSLPDLILLSSGTAPREKIETAKRLRENFKLPQTVPVVIFEVAEDAESSIGNNIYLTSPANFDQLRALLYQLLH